MFIKVPLNESGDMTDGHYAGDLLLFSEVELTNQKPSFLRSFSWLQKRRLLIGKSRFIKNRTIYLDLDLRVNVSALKTEQFNSSNQQQTYFQNIPTCVKKLKGPLD